MNYIKLSQKKMQISILFLTILKKLMDQILLTLCKPIIIRFKNKAYLIC